MNSLYMTKNFTNEINTDLIPEGYSWDGKSHWCYTVVEYWGEIARCLICGHFMKSYVCKKHTHDPIRCQPEKEHEWRLDDLQCKAFCKNCGQGSSEIYWRIRHEKQ